MSGFLFCVIVVTFFLLKTRGAGKKQGKDGKLPNLTVTRKEDPYRKKTEKRTERAAAQARQDGHSTTAYLMEKADADAREHEQEKLEEQQRLFRSRGGLEVAERLYDGDPIPRGKRCVVCGYCGADNLLPAAARNTYSCYFCREPLE